MGLRITQEGSAGDCPVRVVGCEDTEVRHNPPVIPYLVVIIRILLRCLASEHSGVQKREESRRGPGKRYRQGGFCHILSLYCHSFSRAASS